MSDWTETRLQRLRDLWKEGVPTSEIGRQLGISKNAVVGKVHRLGLTPRPSPIRPKGSGTTAPQVRRVKPQQATLTSFAMLVVPDPAPLTRVAVPIPPPVVAAPVVPVREPAAPRVRCCAWPMWRTGKRSTHQYCDAPVAGDERKRLTAIYCSRHAALARGQRQPGSNEARA